MSLYTSVFMNNIDDQNRYQEMLQIDYYHIEKYKTVWVVFICLFVVCFSSLSNKTN